MTTLRTIWRKIYPNEDEHRWMALIWLPFTIWFFLDPLSKHTSPSGWVANTVLGTHLHPSVPAGVLPSRSRTG